jgi:vesicle-fusing ATPase
MLAGAVAEEIILGNRSTGAGNDFREATRVAEQIIRNGMSRLGVVDVDNLPGGLRYRVLTEILREQEERVRSYLSERRDVLERVSQLLLEKEKITGEEFRSLIDLPAA